MSDLGNYRDLIITSHPGPSNVFILTLSRPPENRLDASFAQEITRALRAIESAIPLDAPGAIVTRGADAKFWSTRLDLEEVDRNPTANNNGFYPLIATLLDLRVPTIALLTGHTFGGACPLALAHDYRIMNADRGFWCMPPVDLGLHFDGIGALLKAKLAPQTARKMLLEGHRWTGKGAYEEAIVDVTAAPDRMLEEAVRLAERVAPKARKGVYALLRAELWGDAADAFRRISWVHGRETRGFLPTVGKGWKAKM
ncbi:enoyl-hydratase isomerase family protein [Diplodia corticola]|uniref:Enoyl-hydratase isomerase family protein n=1 Tax=Diplodia corticola TaxID=236234 RepID=A0A1J9RKR1_9PEZI|nr:enoyl-hydratase isomerase family protein [Diplodia corticola]OJD33179.1 enoyl-hydratase isomerase family protein [Diplodia corticola]